MNELVGITLAVVGRIVGKRRIIHWLSPIAANRLINKTNRRETAATGYREISHSTAPTTTVKKVIRGGSGGGRGGV